MLVDVIPTVKEVSAQKIYGKTVIVLDIFRCTSTIVTALANGCTEVIPVSSPQEARTVAAKYPQNKCVTAGEINGAKVHGFDLGNSPLEFLDYPLRGKPVILATTNGTDSIKKSKQAKHVLIGSFLNMNAVCSRALSLQRDIIMVCAGTRGNIALEDIMAAGCYACTFGKHNQDIRLSELSRTFYYLYNFFQEHLTQILWTSRSALNLRKLGYENDIKFCLQKNKYRIVPVFRQNSIKLV